LQTADAGGGNQRRPQQPGGFRPPGAPGGLGGFR
jgi:hypothetical protein